jgi:hypothetical protein
VPRVGRQTCRVPVIDAFGARWTFDVSELDDDLAAELLRLWDRTVVTPDDSDRAATDPPPPFVVRRTEAGWLEVHGDLETAEGAAVPYTVSRSLTIASIRRRTGSCLMLHAAGLATEDGGTVALVASSGTGKTTAGRLLGRSLGYVTDETVTVEHDLTVRAYPKPLSLVVDPAAPSVKHEQSPDELALRRAPAALHLSAVAVLERRADAAVPTLTPIGLVEAMQVVLPQTSALPSLDRPLDRLARALTAGHGPYRLVYRDIEDCLGLVSNLAHARDLAPDAVTWTWFDGTGHQGDPTPVPDDLGLATVVCRTAFRDAVLSDGVALVLRELRPVTLPGLAATLWLAAERPCPVSDLLVAATAELGPHPGAVSIVLDTVRALIGDGALRVV